MNDIKGNIWELVRDNCNYFRVINTQKTTKERVIHTRLYVLLSNLITNSQYIIIELDILDQS